MYPHRLIALNLRQDGLSASNVHVAASRGMQLEAVPALNAAADLGMRNREVRT